MSNESRNLHGGVNLLDLVLTDVAGVKTEVLPKIADHCIVEVVAPLPVPETRMIEREVWHFGSAKLERLDSLLKGINWEFIYRGRPEDSARRMTDIVLEKASTCIKKKKLVERKSSNPWLNDRVMLAVNAKRQAHGTTHEKEQAEHCSRVILEEYNAWCWRVKEDLLQMQPGSKSWWAKERQLQMKKQKQCSIPALKTKEGDWVRDPKDKANLLAKCFGDKFSLPGAQTNEYTNLDRVLVD